MTVALIDTDCDPDTVDLPIPGNDDGLRSIEIIVKQLCDAIIEGKAAAISKEAKDAASKQKAPAPPVAVVDKDVDATAG